MTSSKSQSEPYDEFIATIKLVTGEEILTKVIVNQDTAEETVIIENPLICEEVRSHGANIPLGYKFEPWMKMSEEEVFIIHMTSIITMSEIKEKQVILTYNDVVRRGFTRTGNPNITREMGSIGTVTDCRNMIEKLYKGEDATKDTQSK
tara:strand:+ start:2991 stop:3437 length:447 start_codon:yes stop_codon:yes gene_type:complete